MDEDYKVFFDNFKEMQDWLGRRPGNKIVDPYWVKQAMGKTFVWDDYAKKWRRLSPGNILFKREDGTVGREVA